MSLKEKAIELYEKEKKLTAESNAREAENFAKKSLEALKEMLGNEYSDIKIVVKQPGATSFRVDGILFRVATQQGYHVTNIIQKCPICETELDIRVLNLKDIGKALVEPHVKYDCDRMLEIKKEMEQEKNGIVLSTDARLLEAIRDFVKENETPCSYY